MEKALAQKAAWPASLVFDIALEAYGLEELLEKHDMTRPQLEALYENKRFRRELIDARAELQETGGKFRACARTQAESYLQTMDDLMASPDVAAATKVTIFQSMVKYANLEPQKTTEQAGGGAPTFVVQINT